jgi:hypothetical protein
MRSKWFELKAEATKRRKLGGSIREIEKDLGIPRSTLSGWFKNIVLKQKIQYKLTERRLQSLIEARKLAVLRHNELKKVRIRLAQEEALKCLLGLDLQNEAIVNLALAMLYLGEGGKTSDETILGSSSPLILKFFIKVLINYYKIKPSKISCSLHLRFDQDSEEQKQYWSQQLNLPILNFRTSSVDKRTVKNPTYSYYHGVCVVRCGNIALQRKLIHLSQIFCERIINEGG